MLQARLTRLGAPIEVLRVVATSQAGVAKLARTKAVKDQYQDVGASAVSSQGIAHTNNTRGNKNDVIVRTIDLAALISVVARRVRAAGGKILMKLDVEGTEFTLVPWLMATRTMCDIDMLFIEWHHRYFSGGDATRVVRALNLSHETSGKGPLNRYIGMMPGGLQRGIDVACAPRTRVQTLDDESFLNDGRPWPDRNGEPLCLALTDEPGDESRRRVAPSSNPFRPIFDYWQWVYDDFENEGLLWLLHSLIGLLTFATCWCTYNCAMCARDMAEQDEDL